jgi:FMN reductase
VFVVGIGGTTRSESTSERALRIALATAEAGGATVEVFGAERLTALPMYNPAEAERCRDAADFVEAVRVADAVVVASPGYHGTISGLVKNALDYIEELRDDDRPYLSDRPFGCIATAAGWQAAVTTLTSLRTVAHALRAWPTPLGAALNTLDNAFDEQGACSERTRFQLDTIGREVVEFARARSAVAL